MLTALRTQFDRLIFYWPLERSGHFRYGVNHAHLPPRPNTASDDSVSVDLLDGSCRTQGHALNHFILLTALQRHIGAS
jgi:hypothetical protein